MTSFGTQAYRLASRALAPAVPLLLRHRVIRGKEHSERTAERLGFASIPRPSGQLIWVHGASVGECVAALPLIDALKSTLDCRMLLTSGTVTSAKVMHDRLPADVVHQFVPIDTPDATVRFLEHWKPQAGLFVDSDIWPNLVLNSRQYGVKLALVNARMSERSFKSWRLVRQTATELLSSFSICLAQDEEIAARFRALGASNVCVVGSLKADAPLLPADPGKLQSLRAAIGERPVLLASQTHPGEEETILPAQDLLRRTFPNLLTIIAPRHPERGESIAALCATRPTKRRSQSELPDANTAVYIADTMGELGLFYRLVKFCFVGGSLIRHGGQNPLEPAKLDCGVLAGPHIFNFTKSYETIFAEQGMGEVSSTTEISRLAARLLGDAAEAHRIGQAAALGAKRLGGAVAKTQDAVVTMLNARA